MSRDLEGKTVVITGANTGIGRATAEELAARGARLVLACRSAERTQPVLDAIATAGGRADFVSLDLSDLDQIREAAADVLGRTGRIDVLVNNAGVAGARGKTRQGFELAFGINHLGHFLWTHLLLERVRASGHARVVTVASEAHRVCRKLDLDAVKNATSLTGWPEYGRSKLCNILFTSELARRENVSVLTSYSLHPGVIASDIWRRLPDPVTRVARRFMKTTEEGARTSIWCASDPGLATDSGRYYENCQEKRPSRLARDSGLAARLWTRSMDWAGL